jgi:hypothetical protein
MGIGGAPFSGFVPSAGSVEGEGTRQGCISLWIPEFAHIEDRTQIADLLRAAIFFGQCGAGLPTTEPDIEPRFSIIGARSTQQYTQNWFAGVEGQFPAKCNNLGRLEGVVGWKRV